MGSEMQIALEMYYVYLHTHYTYVRICVCVCIVLFGISNIIPRHNYSII